MHSDLKPENILVQTDSVTGDLLSLKMIDFGTSFSLRERGSVSITTPEYMPPEVLQLFISSGGNINKSSNTTLSQIEQLRSICKPWSIDVWSLGTILLEILSGVPHWMGYKCRIVDRGTGKSSFKSGLFSVKG